MTPRQVSPSSVWHFMWTWKSPTYQRQLKSDEKAAAHLKSRVARRQKKSDWLTCKCNPMQLFFSRGWLLTLLITFFTPLLIAATAVMRLRHGVSLRHAVTHFEAGKFSCIIFIKQKTSAVVRHLHLLDWRYVSTCFISCFTLLCVMAVTICLLCLSYFFGAELD